jgi:hypothetical protein
MDSYTRLSEVVSHQEALMDMESIKNETNEQISILNEIFNTITSNNSNDMNELDTRKKTEFDSELNSLDLVNFEPVYNNM